VDVTATAPAPSRLRRLRWASSRHATTGPASPGPTLGRPESAPPAEPGLPEDREQGTSERKKLDSFEIPRLGRVLRHASVPVLEGVLVPLGLFYLFVEVGGTRTAMYATLVWTWLAIVRRLVTRQRVSGLLVLGALGVTAKTALALAMRSTFIYFLQPSLGTAMVGIAFAVSAFSAQPLAQRLANDFVPIPADFLRRPAIRAVFVRITLLFAVADLVNATGAISLLVTTPLTTYLAARTALSSVATGSAVVVSAWLFRRTVHRLAMAST
jgi:hypothetical protein